MVSNGLMFIIFRRVFWTLCEGHQFKIVERAVASNSTENGSPQTDSASFLKILHSPTWVEKFPVPQLDEVRFRHDSRQHR